MIRIDNLYKSYQLGQEKIPVLKQLKLGVKEGSFIALTGKSGSGKTTLLNIIGLLDHYNAGTYHLNGRLMENLSEKEAAILRNKYIGFVFQSFQLLPFKTALENVALPLFYQRKWKRKYVEDKAKEVLCKVGLSDRIHHFPAGLSGGQKQRVAIARALITDPQLILADEPTGALDTNTSNEIMKLLKAINREGKTIIVVTHDKEIAGQCRQVIEMRDGELVDAFSGEDVSPLRGLRDRVESNQGL